MLLRGRKIYDFQMHRGTDFHLAWIGARNLKKIVRARAVFAGWTQAVAAATSCHATQCQKVTKVDTVNTT